MSFGRRALLGLLVATLILAAVEGSARLLTGPPEVPVVVSMPDGSLGLWATAESGHLVPMLAEHAEWWPTGPKQAGRPRVVLLGGSSLAAPPDDPTRAASLLAQGLGVEVVNLAVSGMDSGHLLAEIPGVLTLEPDLVIIYSGHNDLGNAVFEQRYTDLRSVTLARAQAFLGHSRVFELLQARLRESESRTVNQHFAVEEQTLSSNRRAAAISDFERRLDSLVRQLSQAGLSVALSTVVSNPVFPSVVWQCPDAMTQLGLVPSHRAVEPVDTVDDAALAAARVATPCADLDLVAARRLWDAGQTQTAAQLIDDLRDQDPAPLRAPRSVNAAIRRVAARSEQTLVDSNAAFRQRGGGIEPALFFKDQVHVNELGERALAAALSVAVVPLVQGAVPLSWPELPQRPLSSCLSRRCPGAARRHHRR